MPNGPVHADAMRTLHARRLRQLIMLLLAMLATFTLASTRFLQWPVFGSLVAGMAALSAAWWRLDRGHERSALMIVLWSVTLLATAILWLRGGVRDLFVLAYPLVLVLAALTTSPRPLLALGATMAASLGLLTLAETKGWMDFTPLPTGGWSFFDRVLLLAVLAVCVRTLALDLQAAVHRAEAEGSRAKDHAARLAFLVQHDALTGLPNRLLVQDRFVQAEARARREGRPLALVVIDLDDFRRVNDSLGHAVGDAVLQRMAERLRLVVADTDTLGRLGADEFVVLATEAGDPDALGVLAQRLLDGLAEPFERDGLAIACGSSIGIAQYPRDGNSFESLLNRAEAALARAKADGRNGFRFADPEVDIDVGEHLRLVSELRGAADRGELELHYQPLVRLADDALVGVEALIRWRHRERGFVPPSAFIPLAERSGLIHAIGVWAIREACLQARRWDARGLAPMVVSVNVSPVQLGVGDLDARVAKALAESTLPPARLQLELTESSLLGDASPLRDQLIRLRALGVGLSIDDFGTGYSNLGYLQRFDVQALKIDQRFVRGLADGPQGEAIVRAIAQLAASLGIRTVAEGIESAGEAERLKALGCDAGQGHWWGDAMPAAVFTRWYSERFPDHAAQIAQR